mgnify:FL=1
MNGYEYYLKDVWEKTLQLIKTNQSVNEQTIDLIFNGSKLDNIEDSIAKIQADSFLSFTIMDQHKTDIELGLQSILSDDSIKCRIVEKSEEKKPTTVTLFKNEFFDRELDPSMNFTSFVLGKSNSQAQVASLTCAKNLGLVYNPLFIYGNSGLGKTHLLNAIGNEVTSNMPNKKIGFISGNDFIDALQKARKNGNTDEFKSSFFDLDLLLIDDIQFIAGKEWTQEVFFSIFTKLVNNRKQICITADRSPGDIKGLEDRLLSRFNQGLNVNIESPEYETSIRILKMKIANNVSFQDKVDEEVLSYIATNFSKDVRSLEGAINRLLFYFINFNFSGEDHITMKLAYDAFKGEVVENSTKNELSIAKIRKAVCDYYNITRQQICSANRTKNIAIPRHIAMYLCREMLDSPYKEIGNEFGKRDHSTVINACEKVEKLCKSDSAYLKAITDIKTRIS